MEQFHYYYRNKASGIAIEQAIYRTGSYHYNWHTELELLVVLHGEIEVCSQFAAGCVLREDDLILINPNSGHATFARTPQSVAMVLHADPSFFRAYYKDAEHLRFEICSSKENVGAEKFAALRQTLALMAENIKADTPERRLMLDGAFYRLMVSIAVNFPPKRAISASFQADEKKLAAMNSIIKFIGKNYRQKISLDALAKNVGYNSSYLSQLFKNNLGINFYDYLTRVRLREATRQLSQTKEKILDIALTNGFPDLKSFNRAFRSAFCKTPQEYRSRLNEDHALTDRAFKKEYLSLSDPCVRAKLEQYRLGNTAANMSGTSAVKPNADLLEKAQIIARDARELAAHAELFGKLLAPQPASSHKNSNADAKNCREI